MRGNIDWNRSDIDWNMNDAQLGRAMGVSREAVRQQRKKLKKGEPEAYNQREDSARIRIVNMKGRSKKTLKEIAAAAGCKQAYARTVLREEKLSYKETPPNYRTKYDWAKVKEKDWDKLTNRQIADKVGDGCSPAIVASRRARRLARLEKEAAKGVETVAKAKKTKQGSKKEAANV